MKANKLDEKKKWQKALDKTKELELLNNTMAVVETAPTSTLAHEQALDTFIDKGNHMVESGELKITATTYIQAIKAKADIQKSDKDRRYDALKSIFSGAAPKNDETV